MNPFLANAAYLAIRMYIRYAADTKLFDRVMELVRGLLSASMDGDEKKQLVREAIWKEASHMSAFLIDTAIIGSLLKLRR